MRLGARGWMLAGTMLGGGIALAQSTAVAPPPVTVQDCTKLKGAAKKDCQAKAAQNAAPASAPATGADRFPFPEEQSKGAGAPGATADMPTGEPDPPAESMKPMHVPGAEADRPGDSSSSSSSSTPDGSPPPPVDDDAAPTTSGSDTPIRPGTLKDLGSRGDSSAARQKLEQSRVEDDLRVGHYYFKDGDYAGATARYRDALAHDADNPDAHFGLAEVLVKQNKQAEAIAQLERYLQLAPDDDHTKDARKLLAKLKH